MTDEPATESTLRWRRVRPWLLSVVAWSAAMGLLAALASHTERSWTYYFTAATFLGTIAGAAVGGIGAASGGAWRGTHAGAGLVLAITAAAVLVNPALGGSLLFLGMLFIAPVALLGARIEPRRRRLRDNSGAAAVLCTAHLVLVLVALVMLPSYLPARIRGMAMSCQGNLRQIESARQQWAIDQKKGPTAVPRMSELIPTYLRMSPVCPSGGAYTLGPVSRDPTCSYAGTNSEHQLAQ
jgi:MFS family permease